MNAKTKEYLDDFLMVQGITLLALALLPLLVLFVCFVLVCYIIFWFTELFIEIEYKNFIKERLK